MANEWDEKQKITFPVEVTPWKPDDSRVRCHCVGMLGQRCFACDPDGTMYGVVRPELAVRAEG